MRHAQMRHDYDNGFHAPWCGACGAESDAKQDAEARFEDAQWEACIAVLNKIASACLLSIPMGTVRAKAEAITDLANELDDLANEKFSWPDHTEFGNA